MFCILLKYSVVLKMYEYVLSIVLPNSESLLYMYKIIKPSGISNIRLVVVYKANNEVCTQVVAFSGVARPGNAGWGQNDDDMTITY